MYRELTRYNFGNATGRHANVRRLISNDAAPVLSGLTQFNCIFILFEQSGIELQYIAMADRMNVLFKCTTSALTDEFCRSAPNIRGIECGEFVERCAIPITGEDEPAVKTTRRSNKIGPRNLLSKRI